jgi:hypothetical protein
MVADLQAMCNALNVHALQPCQMCLTACWQLREAEVVCCCCCCLQDNCSDISYRSLTHAIDMEQQPLWNGEQLNSGCSAA